MANGQNIQLFHQLGQDLLRKYHSLERSTELKDPEKVMLMIYLQSEHTEVIMGQQTILLTNEINRFKLWSGKSLSVMTSVVTGSIAGLGIAIAFAFGLVKRP